MKNTDSKKRFSNRVENYIKFRPDYPKEIIQFLKKKCSLTKEYLIADIGSGTGISAKIFLENGNKVFGVEPNLEMRTAGEKILKDYKNFISINGSAEISGLNKNSIDFIICSQSFHWFDRILCKKEFCRILKNNGYLVLIWNSRISKHGFMDEYENLLLKFGIDYVNVNHDNIDESEIRNFFSPSSYVLKKIGNHQDLNFDSLLGRLLSSSYVPLKGSPDFDGMIIELKKIFNKNNYNGKVKMKYETIVYCGKIFYRKFEI